MNKGWYNCQEGGRGWQVSAWTWPRQTASCPNPSLASQLLLLWNSKTAQTALSFLYGYRGSIFHNIKCLCANLSKSVHDSMISKAINKSALCHSLFRYIFPHTPLLPSLELLQLELRTQSLWCEPSQWHIAHCLGECAGLAVSFYRFLGNLAMNFNWIPGLRGVWSDNVGIRA